MPAGMQRTHSAAAIVRLNVEEANKITEGKRGIFEDVNERIFIPS